MTDTKSVFDIRPEEPREPRYSVDGTNVELVKWSRSYKPVRAGNLEVDEPIWQAIVAEFAGQPVSAQSMHDVGRLIQRLEGVPETQQGEP